MCIYRDTRDTHQCVYTGMLEIHINMCIQGYWGYISRCVYKDTGDTDQCVYTRMLGSGDTNQGVYKDTRDAHQCMYRITKDTHQGL